MFGRLIGRLMAIANRVPNDLAIDALHLQPGDVSLDAGCGPGRAIALMAARMPMGRVYGIDQSSVMIEQARFANRASVEAGRVVLGHADFQALPFPDGSFDKVLASNVIYFWTDPHAALREIMRVLKPGGRLVVYATDSASMRGWKFAGPETHRVYDGAGLSELLMKGLPPGTAVDVRSIQVTRRIRGLLAIVIRGA